MDPKIRIGVVGASTQPSLWAARSHLPALGGSPDAELTAVCTTRQSSADEAAAKFGARLAFADYRQMVTSPEIDAVAVVVRVPFHYEVTKAAIDAGKHVYTEWPLGRTTEEAIELAALASSRHVVSAVGVQARVLPGYRYMKDLIDEGLIGEVLSSRARTLTAGALGRPADRAWAHDAEVGANTLTIANGHTLDTVRFLLGEFTSLTAMVEARVDQWVVTDTNETVASTAPDTVFVNGRLESGALVSSSVILAPFARHGFSIEVFGRKGTLVVSGDYHPQNCDLRLQASIGTNELEDLAVPERYLTVPPALATGDPYGVAAMYHEFARSILHGDGVHPDFSTAVDLHRLIDAIRSSSESGRAVSL